MSNNVTTTSLTLPADPVADRKAMLLLRKYDFVRMELIQIEHQLAKAATAYGRRRGVWGFRPEHLRIALENDAQAEQAMLDAHGLIIRKER